MHVALWVLAATSLIGAGVCLLRPAHVESTVAASPAPAPNDSAALHGPQPVSAGGR